tara:strand:+ start:1276 stop:1470 length:195 start_codon:yes stop_codon:yes gene_type:complete
MIYDTNPITREAIDKILQRNASNQANLGTESTDLERFETKVKWAELLREIRTLDPEFAEMVQPQ